MTSTSLYLEMARGRLRSKTAAKFNKCTGLVAPSTSARGSNATSRSSALIAPNTTIPPYLQAARERLHVRLVDRFPVVAGAAAASLNANIVHSPPAAAASKNHKSTTKDSDVNNSTASTTSQHVRLRERFLKGYPPAWAELETWTQLSTFDDVPATMLEVMETHQAAVVVTETCPPYNIVYVNAAWTDLCGYTLSQVVGQSFGSLGIACSTLTEQDRLQALQHKLVQQHQQSHIVPVQVATLLTNIKADGSVFTNYLRVRGLYDDDDNNHYRRTNNRRPQYFCGVLQEIPAAMMMFRHDAGMMHNFRSWRPPPPANGSKAQPHKASAAAAAAL